MMGTPRRRGARQSSTDKPDEVQEEFLQVIVDKARMLTGGQASALCLLDSSSLQVHVTAGSGELADRIGDEASAGDVLSGHVLVSPSTALCVTCDSVCCPFTPASLHNHLVAPVRVGNRIRGVLCAISAMPAGVPRNSGPVLARLARMAGSCLAGQRVCGLAEDLGAMTARQRIAGDIHDGAAQKLVRLHMQLDGVLDQISSGIGPRPELLRARDLVTDTIDDLRTMIESLRNPHGPAGTLEEIAEVLNGAARDLGIPESVVSVHAECSCSMPHATATEIRLIVIEALTNASRHAEATAINVRLRLEGREVVVSVTDNGRGLDGLIAPGAAGIRSQSVPQPRGAHFGTDIMRLRASTIGGRLEIRSAPGAGTEVELRWPQPTA